MKNSETYERSWLTYRIEGLQKKIKKIKPRFENTENSITECPRDFSAEFYQNNRNLGKI